MLRSLVSASVAGWLGLSLFVPAVGRGDDAGTEADLSIRDALQQKVSVQIGVTPLESALREVGKQFHVQIFVDRRGLEEAGISPKTEVSLSVKNISLKSALGLITDQVGGIVWTIHDEVLECTTKARVSTKLTTKVYVLREVLGDNLATEYDSAKLANLITAQVFPDTWQAMGGTGAIHAAGTKNPVLVVTQSWPVHQAIGDLLAQLRATYRPDPKVPPPLPMLPEQSGN